MVARIHSSKSIAQALRYNEQKIVLGKAECLDAHLFLKEAQQLSFDEKLRYFQRLTSLNQRTVINTVHLSLNFDKSDCLNKEKLVEISKSYMQKIGFGNQPYLVYQHRDSGHPHLHIVTINIEKSGKRIRLHNLGRVQSEKARQEIEQEWGLTQAKGHRLKQEEKPSYAQKVVYGESGTKQAIAAVIQAVYPQYRYTSLEEYDAVLRLYNVAVEQGSATSRMRQGLVYRVLDAQGQKIGTPIKASAFELRPTLKNLQARYQENEALRQGARMRLENQIHRVLVQPAFRLDAFQETLAREGIHAVIAPTQKNRLQGITYVDHTTNSVFHESALDTRYRSQALLQRYVQTPSRKQSVSAGEAEKLRQQMTPQQRLAPGPAMDSNLLQILLAPLPTQDGVPDVLKQTKKKRKRIYQHL
jgi:hypothetical protein